MAPEIRIKLERIDPCELARTNPLLSSSQLVRLAGPEVLRQGKAVRFGARAQLFHQSERGASLFFVITGTVRLYAQAQSEGVELGLVGPGEVVGESALLEPAGARACSACAQGPVDAVELERGALAQVMPVLSQYLRELHAQRMTRLKELTDFLNRW